MTGYDTALPESYALDAARDFMGSVLHATDEQLDTLTLVDAVTHAVDAFTTVPAVLATSDEPESGKTTVLDQVILLGANGWMAKPTSYAVTSKFIEAHQQGKHITLCLDEISKIFGESGLNGRQNPLYGTAVERYRKTATMSVSVNRVATDVSCYGVTFMSGLRTAVPSDLRSRSIVIEMKPVPARVKLDDLLDPSVEAIGKATGETLGAWARSRQELMRAFALNGLRRIHPKLRARRKQIWGPLFAVAHIAGGTWPARCLSAFQALALNADDRPVLTPEQQVLLDTADYLATEGKDRVLTADLLAHLRLMDDRSLYEALSDERFVKLMGAALGPSVTIRDGNRRGMGRYADTIVLAATRLHAALYDAEVGEDELDETEAELAVTEDENTESSVMDVMAAGSDNPVLETAPASRVIRVMDVMGPQTERPDAVGPGTLRPASKLTVADIERRQRK